MGNVYWILVTKRKLMIIYPLQAQKLNLEAAAEQEEVYNFPAENWVVENFVLPS